MSTASEPRRSLFPSLLAGYKDSGARARLKEGGTAAPSPPPKFPHISAATPRQPTTTASTSAATATNDAPAPTKRIISKIRTYHEQEQSRKRMKRAAAMQREWEAIQERERDRKKEVLEQRVIIQRQLISKTDLLSRHLWNVAEERRQKELDERRKARLEMTRALREHIKRIEEHKRRIAEKLQRSSGDLTSEGVTTSSYDHEHAGGGGGGGGGGGEITSSEAEHIQQEQDDHDLYEAQSAEPSITVEDVWDGLKAKSAKKLQNIATQSDLLKKSISSPSARLCLEIYERPMTHSSSTGKPVPFTELITHSNEVREKPPYTAQPHLLAASLRQRERKAQYMMGRKEHPTTAPQGGGGPEWYGLAPPTERSAAENAAVDTTSEHRASPSNKADVNSDDEETESLVAADDVKDNPATHADDRYKGPRVFFTDMVPEAPPLDSSKGGNGPISDGNVNHSVKRSGWQPLSQGALTEYTTVSELPMRGHGGHMHGQYKMWKPY